MTTHKIVIEPNKHNGWKLEFIPSHDGKSDYRANKPGGSVYAESLPLLIQSCNKADIITVKFRKPITALHKDGYSPMGFVPVKITMLCGERFVYVDSDGETREGFIGWLSLTKENIQGRERGRWILDNAANAKTRKTISALTLKISLLEDEAGKARARLQPLTEADLRLAVEEG